MTGSTPVTLLERLRRTAEPGDWRRLHELYAPVLLVWLRRHRLQRADAEDVVQDVLSVVARRLPDFRHSGRSGAFRAWLRAILTNELHVFWRRRKRAPTAGGADVERLLAQLHDPASELCRLWDEEHDRAIMGRLLDLVQRDFEPLTWQAFQRLVLDGVATAVVAAELGLTPNAVRIAKSRVFRRLRQESGGLVD